MPVIVDFCGARTRLTLAAARELGRSWAFQPKVDGEYARISTDRHGRAVAALGKRGAPIAAARELLGIPTGLPLATLHGELEAHTEAGIRARDTAGFARAWLFDVTSLGGRSIARLPYDRRRGLLHQHQALAELEREPTWARDADGNLHDLRTGQFCAGVPRDERRFPVVHQERGAGAAARLWRDHVELAGGEGIVAVALEAPAGARGAKRKIKPTDTLDARVIAIGGGAAVLEYGGHTFTVSARAAWATDVVAGDLVEVAHDGWYERGATPRFARMMRARHDLRAA